MAERTYFVLVGKRREGKPAEAPRKNVSKVVEDYPNKVLAEVTASQHQELLRQGYKVEDLSSRTKIRVGRLAIDPTIPEEREEAVGPAEEEEALETEYYFVQFVGPVKSEWIEDLKKANLVPLSYYHDFTYLVYGKTADIEKVAKSPCVRATMPYGPQVKLSSEAKSILEEEGVEQVTREFWILIFTTKGDVQQTIARLKHLGVELIGEEERRAFYQKIHVQIPMAALREVARIPGVYSIEPFHPIVPEDEVADQIVAGNYNEANEPQVGYTDWLNEMGVDGTGVAIGINDFGIDQNHPAFTGRLNKVAGGIHSHGTMVAGQAAGNYVTAQAPDVADDLVDDNGFMYGIGIAPGADLLDIDSAQQCVTNAGPSGDTGRIINNSWGQGTADPMDYQANERAWDEDVRDANPGVPGNTPLIVCFSAGNEGANGLTRPKASKNTIVTGNFENYRPDVHGVNADDINERWPISSIGNCGDDRVKPDVVAPGEYTASAAYPQPGAISHWLRYGGGTSAASPKTAGACALIIQWWRQRHTVDAIEHTPSPALVKAMLINGAVDTGEGGPIPNNEQGWGRINLNNVFNAELPAIYVDQEILLQPGSADIEFDIEPIDTTQPLKITLVWTDVPGAIGSGTPGNPALVNALGLEVTQGANTWFGNNFAGGWSQTGGVQDAIQNANPGAIVNNVQNVFIPNPSGDYHVRISPENIVGDCLDPSSPYDNPADFRQDFALVIQNARLKTTEPLDVMLVIDRTGSMKGDRIAAAIASGQEFFDLIPTGANHRAGLVSYAAPFQPIDAPLDDKVTVDVDMDEVTDVLKTTAQGLIGAMTAGGWTSIGAGLTKAMQRIVDNGEPLHRKVIVLLSDGKENRPPYVNEILPRLCKEYRVHAVGVGGSINGPLMQQIADATHAEFLHTLDPDDIALLYQQIFALEADEEIVGQEKGSLGAGEEEEADGQVKKFPLVNSDSQATFVVTWKNPAVSLDVELVTPKGETITPDKAQRSRTMSYVKRATHLIYTLQRPGGRAPDWEGEWSVKIRRASGSATVAETYTASVLVRSSLQLKLLWDKVKYFTKDLMRLKARLIDKQFVLKDGVKMVTRITAPVKSYGAVLAGTAKRVTSRAEEDAVEGALAALDRLSEEEWQALYMESEEESEITFEVGGVEGRGGTGIFMTSHIANLKRLFRPMRDGIYTYRIKVEGRTASGARYTRVHTVSKYIGAKADAKKSMVVLQPVRPKQPKVWRLTFTPKDLHGNLVGPGRATAIKVDVEKGTLRGKVEDLLDGSYVVEVEATERPEEMAITVSMDDVSIPVRVPGAVTPVVAPVPVPAKELEGKVEQLRFDEKGNFLGFTLRTVTRTVDFPSISSRLAEILAEAMEKNLTVIIGRDETTGDVNKILIESP
jgi:uncharacterized protein YegL